MTCEHHADLGAIRMVCDALLETGGKPVKEALQMLALLGAPTVDLMEAMQKGAELVVRLPGGNLARAFVEKASVMHEAPDQHRFVSCRSTIEAGDRSLSLSIDVTFKVVGRYP